MAIDYTEIGRRIAARRKELSLKQRQLCEMIDVNYKYVSSLETGRSAPSLEMIMRLCDALETTPDYLLLGTDGKSEALFDKQLFEKIGRLTPPDKRLIGGIADLLDERTR